MVGDAVGAIGILEDRAERLTGHVGVEEVAEAVAPPVLAGRVVRVRQAAHEDDAGLLAERLHGDRDA